MRTHHRSRKPHHGRTVMLWLVCLAFILSSAWSISAIAKPRKVNSVEWKTNWIHPGGTTVRSKDLKHLITQLPNANAIRDDYLSYFRVNLGHGQSTVVTITPLNYQNTISCPSLSTNKGKIEGSCRAKHKNLKKFPKNTKITLKVKTPGNPPRYIYWTIKPRRSALRPNARSRATQIYEIGPSHMTAFIQNARIKGYTFHVIPQDHFDNPPGNLQKPGVFPLQITDPSPRPERTINYVWERGSTSHSTYTVIGTGHRHGSFHVCRKNDVKCWLDLFVG